MHKQLAIIATIFIAIFLSLLPMPTWTVWLRPSWVLLFLIYWAMMLPDDIGVGTAWIVGLMVDLLTGTLFGAHALAYVMVIYVVDKLYVRLRIAPLAQQCITVLALLFLYQSTIYIIQGFDHSLPQNTLFWLSPVTSAFLWPWLSIVLRDYSKRFKVTLP